MILYHICLFRQAFDFSAGFECSLFFCLQGSGGKRTGNQVIDDFLSARPSSVRDLLHGQKRAKSS